MALAGSALAVALALGWWMSRMLGGMTGDTYGAVNELAEAAALLLGIVFVYLWPTLFFAPYWD